MGDPFLNYFALFLLVFVVVVLFYAIIAIHDIPYKITESPEHPHQDAIHAAGWVSLFTLHALWPFLWIWAMAYKPDRGWGFDRKPGQPSSPAEAVAELDELKQRLAAIESKLGIRDGGDRPALVPEPTPSALEKQTVPDAEAAAVASRGASR